MATLALHSAAVTTSTPALTYEMPLPFTCRAPEPKGATSTDAGSCR